MPNGTHDDTLKYILEELRGLTKAFGDFNREMHGELKGIRDGDHAQDLKIKDLENKYDGWKKTMDTHAGGCPLNKEEIARMIEIRLPGALDDAIVKKTKMVKALLWIIGILAAAGGGDVILQTISKMNGG